jgi:hypothetical protein
MPDGQDLIPKGLRAEALSIRRGRVDISVAPVARSAQCPVCGRPSRRVHSRYSRKIADLPWHGAPVVFRARVRRFFCDEPSCERLPEVAAHARKTGRLEEAAQKRHERVVERWRDIRRLYLAGADLRHICRELGVSPRTIYRYKDLAEPPPRPAYKRRASVLDPYVPYLVLRWNEGCHNSKKLYREIRERGYQNSKETCTHFVGQLRRAEADGKPPSSVPRTRRGSVAGLSRNSRKYVPKKSPRGNTIVGVAPASDARYVGSAIDTAGLITPPFSERKGRR